MRHLTSMSIRQRQTAGQSWYVDSFVGMCRMYFIIFLNEDEALTLVFIRHFWLTENVG